eukprot:gene6671-9153_t
MSMIENSSVISNKNSLSDIMSNLLDIMDDPNDNNSNKPSIAYSSSIVKQDNDVKKSASSILLDERKKLKRTFNETTISSFEKSQRIHKEPSLLKPNLYDQIATSSVDAPKYWSGANLSTARPKSSILVKQPLTKWKLKHKKGEDYKDKFQAKVTKKTMKNNHIKAISGTR